MHRLMLEANEKYVYLKLTIHTEKEGRDTEGEGGDGRRGETEMVGRGREMEAG